MITYVSGDLFLSPAQVLVNTVNTVGVMGKGIAKTFKKIYPEMFREYQRFCEEKKFKVGMLWLYRTSHKLILNFPTKQHWRQPSRSEYIEAGLNKFVATYGKLGITSVAFPRLGCGNGELDWEAVVQPLMEKYLENLAIDVFVYYSEEAARPPEHKAVEATAEWLRSEPRTLAFVEVWTDLVDSIGTGRTLRTWDDVSDFQILLESEPEPGLLIKTGSRNLLDRAKKFASKMLPYKWRPVIRESGDVFVSQKAMLDLWQNVREYGFCVDRIIPVGLDVLAPWLMSAIALLEYLVPVQISVPNAKAMPTTQKALQLSPAHASRSKIETQAFTVQLA